MHKILEFSPRATRRLAIITVSAAAALAFAMPAAAQDKTPTARVSPPQQITHAAPVARPTGTPELCLSLAELILNMGRARDRGVPLETALAVLRPAPDHNHIVRAALPHVRALATQLWANPSFPAERASGAFYAGCVRGR